MQRRIRSIYRTFQKLIPTKPQWYSWTMLSKIGYISGVITILTFVKCFSNKIVEWSTPKSIVSSVECNYQTIIDNLNSQGYDINDKEKLLYQLLGSDFKLKLRDSVICKNTMEVLKKRGIEIQIEKIAEFDDLQKDHIGENVRFVVDSLVHELKFQEARNEIDLVLLNSDELRENEKVKLHVIKVITYLLEERYDEAQNLIDLLLVNDISLEFANLMMYGAEKFRVPIISINTGRKYLSELARKYPDSIPDTPEFARFLVLYGFNTILNDRPDVGEKFGKNALEINEKNSETKDSVLALNYLLIGSAQLNLQKYNESRKNLLLALQLIDNSTDQITKVNVLDILGNFHHAVGEYETANHYFKRVIDLMMKHSTIFDESDIGVVYGDLAANYDLLGELDKSEEFYKKAYPLVPKHHYLEYANLISNIAESLILRKMYYEAKLRKEAALKIYEKVLPKGHKYIEGTKQRLKYIDSFDKIKA